MTDTHSFCAEELEWSGRMVTIVCVLTHKVVALRSTHTINCFILAAVLQRLRGWALGKVGRSIAQWFSWRDRAGGPER